MSHLDPACIERVEILKSLLAAQSPLQNDQRADIPEFLPVEQKVTRLCSTTEILEIRLTA